MAKFVGAFQECHPGIGEIFVNGNGEIEGFECLFVIDVITPCPIGPVLRRSLQHAPARSAGDRNERRDRLGVIENSLTRGSDWSICNSLMNRIYIGGRNTHRATGDLHIASPARVCSDPVST